MPMSDTHHIPAVLHYAFALQPQTVLDVGVGMGAYGFLLRQYLDVGQERIHRPDWRVRIDGVEVFEGYRNPVWDYAYDRVVLDDVRAVLPSLGRYDLVLLNDVLEHFERETARALLRDVLSRSAAVVATTPNREYPQGAWAGNEAETHRSLLDATDFPHLVAEHRIGITSCYVCSADPHTAERLRAAAVTCPVVAPRLLPRVTARLERGWRGAIRRLRTT